MWLSCVLSRIDCGTIIHMSEPQSPFDEPDDVAEQTDVVLEPLRKLPERKWSFIGLGIVLFVLVWVREFTGMPFEVVFATAVGVLLLWQFIHLRWFVELPTDPLQTRSEGHVSAAVANARTASASTRRRVLARRRLNVACLGVLIGSWVAYSVAASFVGLESLMGFSVAVAAMYVVFSVWEYIAVR